MASSLRAVQKQMRAQRRGDKPVLPAVEEGVIIPGALWYETAALQPGAQIAPRLTFAGVAKPGAQYLLLVGPVVPLCQSFRQAAETAEGLSRSLGRAVRVPTPIEGRCLYAWISQKITRPLDPFAVWVQGKESPKIFKQGSLVLAEGPASCALVTDATPAEARAINTGKGLKPLKL